MKTSYVAQGWIVINTFKSFSSLRLTSDEIARQAVNYDRDKFLNILGYAYDQGLQSDSDKLDSAMKNLANQSGYNLPTGDSFLSAISAEAKGGATLDLLKYVTVETSKDILAGAESFGKNALDTLKFFNFAFPFILIGGAYLVLRKYYERV